MFKSRNYVHDEHYENAKNVLQRQTAALLAQRRQLEGYYPPREQQRSNIRQTLTQLAPITPVVNGNHTDNGKTQQVVDRLQQIIKLCKEEGALSGEQMREVLKVENEVLSYLQKTTGEAEPQVVRPDIQSPRIVKSKTEIAQNNQAISLQTWGKEQKTFLSTQDTIQIISQIQRKALGQIIHLQQERDNIKKERDQLLQELQKAKGQTMNYQQRQIQKIKVEQWTREDQRTKTDQKTKQDHRIKEDQRNKQQHRIKEQQLRLKVEQQRATQEQLQKISRVKNAQIQRLIEQNKALRISNSQLERFRHQQSRMPRVNNNELDRFKHQNKLLRDENQTLISRLQAMGNASHLARQVRKTDYRQSQPQNQAIRTGLAYGQYDSQIAVYQNELRRASVVINQLRSRLANVPGLEDLHQQGQRIRRQTTQLLQIKSNSGHQGYQNSEQGLIRELQDRLEEQERGKLVFLQELKAFKQRYVELEEENRTLKKSKVSFDPHPRPLGSTPQRQSISGKGIMKKRASYLGDYEQTLNQMKKALY